MVCAVVIGALISQAIVSRQFEQQANDDLASILESWRNAPPPPLREIGTLTPYNVVSDYNVVEVGGDEQASSSFMTDELGLEVQISIHTCRPRVIHNRDRQGELNLVDGTSEDLCTSGGVMHILDARRGEEFEIYFKLIGTPNGTLGWNARQLVSKRDADQTWLDSLELLRSRLPRHDVSQLPPTIQETTRVVETRDAAPPHVLLMSGDEQEMLRLLSFRRAFRDFYVNPDEPQAHQVARLLIDTLLDSPEQQELSEQWTRQLDEAG
jgi:hypothetical protein